jgi:hypothetical protein
MSIYHNIILGLFMLAVYTLGMITGAALNNQSRPRPLTYKSVFNGNHR